MFDRLAAASLELSYSLDAIEQYAQKELTRESVRSLRYRQLVTLLDRVRIARATTSDQLSMLARELQAA